MRRTTICRSSAALVVAVAALLLCPALAAQDTTQAAPPAPPAQDTAATELFPQQVPSSHVVAKGETLWAIAQMYFGDPLLWPEIYRLNTAVIEDPHWIYPGETLVLAPVVGEMIAQGPADTVVAVDTLAPAADTVRATPLAADTGAVAPVDTMPLDTVQAVIEEPPPPPLPTESYRTSFDEQRTRTQQVQDVLRAYSEQPYRPVRRGEFYAAGWLSEEEDLPWGRVIGATSEPSIPRITSTSSALVGEEIAIDPPDDASYHVGDSLLIARIDREMPDWGDVVVPVGIARVTAVQEQQVLARIIMQFARVKDGRLAIPLEPFKDPGRVRPTAVETGLEGALIAQRDPHAVTSTSEYLFIDKGRADGVVPGDIFEVYRPAGDKVGSGSERVGATIMIVHTRDRSATGLVLNVAHPDLRPGMPVRLIRKMPS